MGLLKSTFWYTLGLLFTRSINFILLPIYSHLLSPREFGIYILILTSYTIVSVFYQGGLQAGFTKFYLEEKDEKQKDNIFLSILNIVFIISILFSVIGFIVSSNISQLLLNSSEYSLHISIAFGMLLFDNLGFYFLHLLRTQEKPKQVTLLTAISGISNFSFNLIFLYIFHLGILGILLAQLISGILMLLFSIPISKIKINFTIEFSSLKKILFFSSPLILAGLFSTLVDFVDRYILDYYFDQATVGLYSFSYRIAMIMNVFVLSYRSAWTPYALTLYNKNELNSTIGKNLSKLFGVLCLIFLSVSILSDDIFNIKISGLSIFNEQYSSGIEIIPFVLAGYAFSGLISIYAISPYISDKSSHFLYADIISFSVNIILNFILIPVIGIIGAAIATMISYAAGLIYYWVASRNVLYVKYEWKDIFITSLMVTVLYLISTNIKSGMVDLLVIVLFLIYLKFYFRVDIKRIFKFSFR